MGAPRHGAFHATDLELILRADGSIPSSSRGLPPISCVTRLRGGCGRVLPLFFLSDGTNGQMEAVTFWRPTCSEPLWRHWAHSLPKCCPWTR